MSTWKKLTQAVSQLSGGSKAIKRPPGAGASTQVDQAKEADDNVLTSEARIVEMLMHTVDSNTEVLISFGSKVIAYKTRLLPEKETGPGASGELSSEYLRDRAYIVIAPTDPPDGTTKLLNNQPATISFVYGGKFNEFESRLFEDLVVLQQSGPSFAAPGYLPRPGMPPMPPRPGMPPMPPRPGMPPKPGLPPMPGAAPKPGMPPGAEAAAKPGKPPGSEEEAADLADEKTSFKVTFPDKVFRKPQRRSTARARYSDDARVALSIGREAGTRFYAPIVDVSTGGICFQLPEEEAPISEGSEVEVIFQYWQDEEEVQITEKGTLLKMGSRQGKTVGQIVFANESYEVIREIGEMVAHVERIRLQARSKK